MTIRMRRVATSSFAALAVGLAFPVVGAPVSAQAEPAAVAATPAVELHGHVREEQGLRILFLRGMLRERSFTEGYLLANEIQTLFRKFGLSKRVVPSPALWNMVVLPGVRTKVTVPDWVRERGEALFEGMLARDEESVWIEELRRELTVDDLVGMCALPDFVGLACSSFATWGDGVEGEGPVVGRNLDYFSTPELLELTMLIVHAPRDDRAGWVGIGWPGFTGLLTGFSDRGVSIAVHDVFKKYRKGAKVTPRTIALQELIESWAPGADPGSAAADVLGSFRYGMGGNAMVAWAKSATHGPGAAVFEVAPAAADEASATLRGPVDNQRFVTCSNHHRKRSEAVQCWRYEALFDGLEAREGEDGDGFDLEAGQELITKSEVKSTLTQSVVDLASGEFYVRVRRKQKQDAWDVATGLNVRDLLTEARQGR